MLHRRSLKWFFLVGFQIILFRDADSPTVILKANGVLLAAVLCWILADYINRRLAFGTRRTVEWDRELVVVTGGSRGLGAAITELLRARNTRVAVLDIVPPKEPHELVKWYRCDVGDTDAVRRAAEIIKQQLGDPTVLINNAGIVNGKTLLDLTPTDVERNFRINLLSQFTSIQCFLPAMLARPQGGTIVTVASVLGHLGAARLSDYAAAKAGLMAMHTSLTAELANMSTEKSPGAANVKILLVKPGQLSTPLFGSLKTPSDFLAPVVDAKDAAAAVVEAIGSGNSGVLAMPLYTRWIEIMSVLPYGVQAVLRRLSGIDRAMSVFRPAAPA